MVWLAGEDLVGAVQLLEQHHPGKLVRQRERPERKPMINLVELEAERTANHEAEVTATRTALLEEAAEGDRVDRRALLVKQRYERTIRQAPSHVFALPDLDQLEPSVACEQLLVVLHVVGEWRTQSTDGDHDDPHKRDTTVHGRPQQA